MHTVFAEKRLNTCSAKPPGPMATSVLHPLISEIHPDLCDDTLDRVIDGRRYGKKWKHAVRTAQAHLKSRGVIGFDGRSWFVVDESNSRP